MDSLTAQIMKKWSGPYSLHKMSKTCLRNLLPNKQSAIKFTIFFSLSQGARWWGNRAPVAPSYVVAQDQYQYNDVSLKLKYIHTVLNIFQLHNTSYF